eukprot:1275557-Amphidinium_carterae.2
MRRLHASTKLVSCIYCTQISLHLLKGKTACAEFCHVDPPATVQCASAKSAASDDACRFFASIKLDFENLYAPVCYLVDALEFVLQANPWNLAHTPGAACTETALALS